MILKSRSSSDLHRRNSGGNNEPSSGGSNRRNSIDTASPDGSENSSPCVERKPQVEEFDGPGKVSVLWKACSTFWATCMLSALLLSCQGIG